MAEIDLGKVVGTDGVNPVVQVVEDSLTSYRLSLQDKTHTVITPNLRGVTATSFTVGIDGWGRRDIPFSELNINPDKEYAFYAAPETDYPLLRQVTAVRVADTLRVAVYYDTMPYTELQCGSPFPGGAIQVGRAGLKIGSFKIGEVLEEKTFLVNVLCQEIL
jgi:hypothetical protein